MFVMGVHPGQERPPGGCELYRINIPFAYLREKAGWQAEWMYMRTLFDLWSKEGPVAIHRFFSKINILVMGRTLVEEHFPAVMLADFFDFARRYGVKVVYEVDDDLTNTHRKVVENDVRTLAAETDAITVTTPYLADLMTSTTGVPAHILPNMLDPSLWHDGKIERRKNSKQVTIWLAGSHTHEKDWRVLEGIFPALLKKHPHAKLVIGGYCPPYLEGIEGMTFIPAMNYAPYAQTIRQCDIVLAPVDPTDAFNMGKSPIKAVEGMGAHRLINGQHMGAAVIATDHPIYRLAVQNERNGLLVAHEPQAWAHALDRLLSDEPYRLRLQKQAYDLVWRSGKWDMKKQVEKWAKAYQVIAALPSRQTETLAMTGEGVLP